VSDKYKDYQEHIIDDIETCLDSLGCQPILFVGSGFSKRYMNAPNWEELLKTTAAICPLTNKEYAYYKQTYKDPIAIGSYFVEPFKEWAWTIGRGEFPAELFSESYKSDIYLKYKISEQIYKISPRSVSEIENKELANELAELRSINPHAIITTNYDMLLETIFDEYEPIIGQKILRTNTFSVGEIFKVHGCITDANTIVLTQADYDEFLAKKKYLSAKLLTFFAEHPLLIIGYSATDPNIKAILSDIDELLSSEGELIPNIYILQRSSSLTETDYPQREHVIALSENRNMRIKCIVANDFNWVFKAFSNNKPIESIHPKILRALLARTYNLVRCDIPRKIVEVDFSTLEHAITTNGEIGKILGITSVGDGTKFNAQFPYSLTQVSEMLGYKYWHPANQLLDKIRRETGTDIKTTDNKYHVAIKAGSVMITHKYSQEAVDLLMALKNQSAYTLDM
jgi:hypothetical protein